MDRVMHTQNKQKSVGKSMQMLGRGAQYRKNNDPKLSDKLTREFLCKEGVTSYERPTMS